MIHIGVTGTSSGATDWQVSNALSVIHLLAAWGPVTVHQGCCVGFDEQMCVAIRERFPDGGVSICAHPPLLDKKLSRLAVELSNHLCEPADYLTRDRRIVHHSTKGLLAAPSGLHYRARGDGTSYTVKYATTYYTDNQNVDVFLPNGQTITGMDFVNPKEFGDV